MHFDLVDLRLYLNVLQAGNITAGASLSHLSLPAASARIRAMEASLGVAFCSAAVVASALPLPGKRWPNMPGYCCSRWSA